MSKQISVELYPRYCFHLAPTFNTWCLLTVKEIHDLHQPAEFEGERFFFFGRLPVKWVRIVGVVVAVDDFAGMRVFTVDDSSGACIEAAKAIPSNASIANAIADSTKVATELPKPSHAQGEPDVGSVVDVKGQLMTFRENTQIKVEKMVCLQTTAQELALWNKRTKFRREVLEQPWELRGRDIRRCRKEAERADYEEEKKKKHLKALTEGATNRFHQPGTSHAGRTEHAKQVRLHASRKPTYR
ncbi:hypothetical protein B0I35DRAFT_411104 [Stachybotrys elegans]|uniref:CST complex subunit Stn1 N-terminal domain-containing protein n=1 Tax=Stachybotrys elegans TaxID=80388 RepID=A0A8K0SN47_9HYPO|nr:hypothetical protein B0I35DRAFT_411104 [Stachybotrys elegans]